MIELNKEILKKLNEKFGDGFYILDTDVFQENYSDLKKAFENYYPNFNIAYSYKTNYIPKLCKIVNKNGGFAEVVSEMELEIAKRCGVITENIIWNGPIKNKEYLKSFLLSGGTANIDNLDEWKWISSIATENNKNILRIGLRCNFDVGDSVVSRFGIDVNSKDFNMICQEISNINNIELTSIQCHFAKRNIEYWEERTRKMLSVYESLQTNYKLRPKRIDLGGALYGKMSDDFANQIGVSSFGFSKYAKASAAIVANFFEKSDYKPLLLIEPGTAVVANCMRAVFKVMNIKSIRKKYFATVFGSQKNISMNGINPPLTIIHGDGPSKYYENLDFVGYTCIEGDYLFKGYKGMLSEGDFIILENCGSYSVVMKPPFILPNFPIIDISKGFDSIEIIKKNETFNDLFNTYIF